VFFCWPNYTSQAIKYTTTAGEYLTNISRDTKFPDNYAVAPLPRNNGAESIFQNSKYFSHFLLDITLFKDYTNTHVVIHHNSIDRPLLAHAGNRAVFLYQILS